MPHQELYSPLMEGLAVDHAEKRLSKAVGDFALYRAETQTQQQAVGPGVTMLRDESGACVQWTGLMPACWTALMDESCHATRHTSHAHDMPIPTQAPLLASSPTAPDRCTDGAGGRAVRASRP